MSLPSLSLSCSDIIATEMKETPQKNSGSSVTSSNNSYLMASLVESQKKPTTINKRGIRNYYIKIYELFGKTSKKFCICELLCP